MNNNVLIVGAGLTGSTMARLLAEDGHRVTIIEQRDHIAGNIYDEYVDGILVQKYGPHYLATFSWDVVSFLMRFTEFYEYPIRAKSLVDGKYIDRPYNFRSLQQLLGPEHSAPVLKHIRDAFPNLHRVTLGEFLASGDEVVVKYGQLLYKTLFATYCAKQWGMKPEEISVDVVNRTDIVLGYETQLDDTDFQYLPKDGFTEMIRRMLDHPFIEVRLGENALEKLSFQHESETVKYDNTDYSLVYYTGELDALFAYQFGELPYISRYFEYEQFEKGPVLPCGVITYPKERDYIRQTEFSQFNPVKSKDGHTIVQSEYPVRMSRDNEKGNEPYYPVLNQENIALHEKYKELATHYKNLLYGGRLADFRYYDMDTSVLKAFDDYRMAKRILEKL